MKVLKMYFLALLLVAFLPLSAQDNSEDESGKDEEAAVEKTESAESSEEAEEEKKEAEEEKAEASAEEKDEGKEKAEAEEETPEKAETKEAKAEEKKPEKAETKEAKAEEKPVAEKKAEKKEEAVADATLKIEDEKDGEESENEEKDKDPKKFSVNISNGFGHNVAKERKSFGYSLSVGANYQLPWKINMSAGVGFAAGYRYDLEEAKPTEEGLQSTEKIDAGVFDGTPLNIGFSRGFNLFWDIGSSVGINVSLPFTSTMLWEQYNIYTILSGEVRVNRAFKVAKETSITLILGYSYSKTFAKDDYAWDDYQNSLLSTINEHSMAPWATISFKYKDFSLAVAGRYNIDRAYSTFQAEYPDGEKVSDTYTPWTYSFSFTTVASYSIKSWNLALGVATNAPETESGNYIGYETFEGDPEVKNPSKNYPFKGKYTRVFANIGYSYSF